MAGDSTTTLQISGHRLMLRRMEHALVRGDVRMLDDPLRAQSLSLVVGGILAVIVVAICAVLAFLAPRGTVGSAPIVMVRDSGALYVRSGDALHPVLNLASARLITGDTGKPHLVSASAVDNAERGPLLGIPGAPNTIGRPLSDSAWTVCDHNGKTTIIVGAQPQKVRSGQALVVVPDEGAAMTYLLYDGRRARVDLRNPAVVRALRLDGLTPRPVSRSLLDVLPEAPALAAPHVPSAGEPSSVRGHPVGSVLRVNRADVSEYYVVLAGGVQRIGEVAADLLRFTRAQGTRDIVTVAPGVIGSVPVVDDLPVGTYPDRADVVREPLLCAAWDMSAGPPKTVVLTSDSIPSEDVVTLPRGHSAYVRAVGVTGDGAESGTLFLVDDTGTAYGINDEDAAARLGLTGPPLPAPWPILARLPRGPALSVVAASVVPTPSPR